MRTPARGSRSPCENAQARKGSASTPPRLPLLINKLLCDRAILRGGATYGCREHALDDAEAAHTVVPNDRSDVQHQKAVECHHEPLVELTHSKPQVGRDEAGKYEAEKHRVEAEMGQGG